MGVAVREEEEAENSEDIERLVPEIEMLQFVLFLILLPVSLCIFSDEIERNSSYDNCLCHCILHFM
jgi:hypothetical protein